MAAMILSELMLSFFSSLETASALFPPSMAIYSSLSFIKYRFVNESLIEKMFATIFLVSVGVITFISDFAFSMYPTKKSTIIIITLPSPIKILFTVFFISLFFISGLVLSLSKYYYYSQQLIILYLNHPFQQSSCHYYSRMHFCLL